MNYKVIRSRRKTLGLQIESSGDVLVRAPFYASDKQIELFVLQHLDWIQTQRRKQLQKQAALRTVKKMTPQQFVRLKTLARKLAQERISYYAPKVGVAYRVSRLSIRCQKTKWGSCTSDGNISINCLLALAPREVFDSVIVHELCHLLEMNHSKRFYGHVLRVFPEYRKWNKWLKENGAMLYAMVPDGY